jgi:hypothetical protein
MVFYCLLCSPECKIPYRGYEQEAGVNNLVQHMANKHYDTVAPLLHADELAVFVRPPTKVINSNKNLIFRRLERLAPPVFSQRTAVEYKQNDIAFRQDRKRGRSPDERDSQAAKKAKPAAGAASSSSSKDVIDLP